MPNIHLQEWSKRLTEAVQVQSDMEELPVNSIPCECSGGQHIRDEL